MMSLMSLMKMMMILKIMSSINIYHCSALKCVIPFFFAFIMKKNGKKLNALLNRKIMMMQVMMITIV